MMEASGSADRELVAWGRFVNRLDLEETCAMRLLFVWVRIRRAYFQD
jgi:hypothetical protein